LNNKPFYKLKRRIAILGSTGSVGIQALDVISSFSEKFVVEVLTAYKNADMLIKQAKVHKPNVVVIGDEKLYEKVSSELFKHDIKVYAGLGAIEQVTAMNTIDMVVMAIVGFDGLKPTIAALQNRKPVALANKESLVVAGDLIRKMSIDNKTPVIPVDSEHSAIFQCLIGESVNTVEKIVLTASGGPFLKSSYNDLKKVTPSGALNHPNWKMGDKISIDSATLMNKGLEAIEAKWLFNLKPSQIEIVIHPQSVIHSLVYFTDGNIKSLMSIPDMRIPIQYALSYPERLKNKLPKLDLINSSPLTFEAPDIEIFRNLALAFEAMKKKGNTPCILNAANEIAVEAFLNGKLNFVNIPDVIERCMYKIPFSDENTLENYVNTDAITRSIAKKIIENNEY
jgi:1-deoxy-D-xylulose-5-phosphate reductoisomerase